MSTPLSAPVPAADIVGEINNFPGAAVPFGMVQYSPDTVGNYAGYDHANDRATGFSMTHASVGCPSFGDISMLPTTSPVGSRPWRAWDRIAHDNTESGVPGYYTVRFPDTGVTAELTATTRTGFGRFSYPRDNRPAAVARALGCIARGQLAAAIQIGEDNTTITGWATSGSFCDKQNTYTVYFAMEFSKPFISYGTWDGYSVYDGARQRELTPVQRWLCPVSGGRRGRGADRCLVCEYQRRPGESGRRAGKLRRRSRGCGERLERCAVAHHGVEPPTPAT